MIPSKDGYETAAGASPGPLAQAVGSLRLHRDLLVTLIERDFKVRYKQSVMGILWAILMPGLIVSAGIVVKTIMARLTGEGLNTEDLALVTVKSVPWAFFVSAIKAGSMSLISNQNLVTKIYTPREVFPFAAVGAALIDFLVGVAVLVVVLPLFGLEARVSIVLVPVLIALLVLLASGLALFLSAASLFFRDVKYLVEVTLMFAIFFTPVFYEASMFGDLSRLILLNPVAPLLEGIGAAVVGGEMVPAGWLVYSAAVSVLGFITALAAFKRMEPYFAESV